MYGIIIGLILGFIIAITPAILIAFSKKISGQTKILWVLAALIIPYILKIIITVIVVALQGHLMPHGLSFLVPLTWYMSAWIIYFYYKRNYRNALVSIEHEKDA